MPRKWFLVIFIQTMLLSVSLALVSSAAAEATKIIIPEVSARPGETIFLPVRVDAVDNLAGVKLVIKYNKDALTFQGAEKTRHTGSLMHIVNDKNPGSLIVVMAGARGIKGKDFSLLDMTFLVNPAAPAGDSPITITEAQLMSDQLKDIDYTTQTGPIHVAGAPEKAPPTDADGQHPVELVPGSEAGE